MGDSNARIGRAKTGKDEWTLGKYGEVVTGRNGEAGQKSAGEAMVEFIKENDLISLKGRS